MYLPRHWESGFLRDFTLIYVIFLSFGEGCVIWASWEGLISAFLSLFFYPDLCLLYVLIGLMCDVCTYPVSL
jgi:hypothetical protein